MKRNQSRGFSFTEILFAVMIIGIGFIMIAAMFPVALQQTENSVSDTVAANVARSGVAVVGQIAQTTFVSAQQPAAVLPEQSMCVLTPTIRVPSSARHAFALWNKCYGPLGPDPVFTASFPALAGPGSITIPGDVWPLDMRQTTPLIDDQVKRINSGPVLPTTNLFDGYVWATAAQNMIQTANPRVAWVAFYRRDITESYSPLGVYSYTYAPYAQVIIVAVQARNVDGFTSSSADPTFPADLTPLTGSLEPVAYPNTTIILPSPTGSIVGGLQLSVAETDPRNRANTGAFAIISTDSLPTNSPYHGALNGHVLRLGAKFQGMTGNAWEFSPGFGLSPSDIKAINNMGGATFTVYMLGMGRDPNSSASPKAFGGPAMDVAVYSSFVQCKGN